jgi:hypothetical protein
MNPWFDEFSARCVDVAARQGAVIDAPALDPAVARELLELTRVVAHGAERQYAPLAAFLAGQALDRMAKATSELSSEDAVLFLQRLRESLDRE